jgi:hypothetical protein
MVEVREISGKVARDRLATGSKSARKAITLHADDGSTYILRRQGGPAFGDRSFDVLVGARISVDGFAVGDTLIVRNFERVK